MTSPTPFSTAEAVESINLSLSDLSDNSNNQDFFENPRRFCGYVTRLQLPLNTLIRTSSSLDTLSPSVQTALKGIAGDLAKAVETVLVYRNRSKIFVLINCISLSDELQECTKAIGAWLALTETSLHDHPELRKKIVDLSRDMKETLFKVTENEERVHCTLQKEGEGRQTTKAVQSAIIMDLMRTLGLESNDLTELTKQIKQLRTDLARSSSVPERRILSSLQRILDSWCIVPDISSLNYDIETEDDVNISPFKSFLCPLTKEVMKEPVVLESSQTYERKAIEYWFERCLDDCRDPICPVTGQVLKSLELKPNIGLAGAIEEWVNRNVDVQVNKAVEVLGEENPQVDCVERVLDIVYKISEEYPFNRYRVRNAGVVLLIVKVLRNSSKSIRTQLRSKALMALLSMAKDEESKKIMLDEGVSKLAIHSLIGSSEKEREYAVKLLLEFSSDRAYCISVALEKGALVLLTSMAGNLEHPALSNLAEEVLKNLEKVDDNVQLLAAAGRFEPLISRLCEGSDDVKIEMAYMVGKMTLTNSSKEQIARQCAKVLVQLLYKSAGRAASLQALYNLSGLDDNATILVDSAVLPALMDILFKDQDASPELNELAAATIANIVSNPGHWELSSADKKGNSMQSESVVSSLLALLSVASPKCQVSILHILCGIASSPQAAGSVATHVKSGDGIKSIFLFLEHPEVEYRAHAFRLTRILSECFGQDLAYELKPFNKPSFFKEKLLDDQSTHGEKSDAACILANIPLSEEEVKRLFEANFIKWIVTNLKNQQRSSNARLFRHIPSMVEGLHGLLLHFTRSLDPPSLIVAREQSLMTVFCEQLSFPSKPKVKQLAALGLKNLSEAGRLLSAADSGKPTPRGVCAVLVAMCGRPPPEPSTCPIHNAHCEDDSQLCLLKSNCIRPLVDLLMDEDTNVQIAAVEALSTLIVDTSKNLKRAVNELDQQGVVDAVIGLFTEVRPGVLQERALWMIERILRVEGHSHRYSLNQSLVRALVEAFKHGNANAKMHAQEALTNLKQISGFSGKGSSQAHSRGR
ncbi:U-box domain-containing protein 44-like [Pistacia vera]|uniref:U-box domain-containing protein 44-like n=1 Tax=Pistacia vera TaxID=55513 RepID=UPI001262F982|nr:U-box domain-containing protein 44-like [Pistacia vera]